MARETRSFVPTVPANTAVSSPAVLDISFPPRKVERIDWLMPEGSMGLVGWYLAMGGVQLLPQQVGQYVIAHGQTGFWEVEDLPDSGAWQLIGYNLGTVQHSVHLVFHLGLIERAAAGYDRLQLVRPVEALDLSHAGPPVRRR